MDHEYSGAMARLREAFFRLQDKANAYDSMQVPNRRIGCRAYISTPRQLWFLRTSSTVRPAEELHGTTITFTYADEVVAP